MTRHSNTMLMLLLSVSFTQGKAADTHLLEGGTLSSATVIGDSSASYRMDWSAGEVGVSEGQSPSYRLSVGFWTGCACDCHADPGGCDGVQTVVDVVQCVNVAFRNAAATPDPNGSCPYQTTDVNCDNITTVIDVVKMVNVTFRNGNPVTEFCNPCL